MEEKRKKKEDDLLAKENRKREREEKKELREAAAKKKAEEMAIKAAALAAKKLQAMEEKKKKGKGKKPVRQSVRSTTELASTSTHGSQFPDQNVCAVFLGSYEDDIVGGELQAEWIQCTNASCSLWMHSDCLSKDPEGLNYICLMCNVTFK